MHSVDYPHIGRENKREELGKKNPAKTNTVSVKYL